MPRYNCVTCQRSVTFFNDDFNCPQCNTDTIRETSDDHQDDNNNPEGHRGHELTLPDSWVRRFWTMHRQMMRLLTTPCELAMSSDSGSIIPRGIVDAASLAASAIIREIEQQNHHTQTQTQNFHPHQFQHQNHHQHQQNQFQNSIQDYNPNHYQTNYNHQNQNLFQNHFEGHNHTNYQNPIVDHTPNYIQGRNSNPNQLQNHHFVDQNYNHKHVQNHHLVDQNYSHNHQIEAEYHFGNHIDHHQTFGTHPSFPSLSAISDMNTLVVEDTNHFDANFNGYQCQMSDPGPGPGPFLINNLSYFDIGQVRDAAIWDIIWNLFIERDSYQLNQGQGGNQPLPPYKMAQLQRVEISKEQIDLKLECPICFDEFNLSEDAIGLTCKHVFHHACLLTWLRLRATCPTCRFDLTKDTRGGVGGEISGSGGGGGGNRGKRRGNGRGNNYNGNHSSRWY